MKVIDILREKKSGVKTISPDKSLKQALRSMMQDKVGSLIVTERENIPLGIITERDILRYIDRVDNWEKTVISDVMTKKLIIGLPDDDVEVIMEFMTKNYFRHVPILDEKKLVGIISIGDIIKAQLQDIKTDNRFLSDYISGKYPA